ncbi:DUF1206 domain-containing protein [Flagellimonas crocea]|uniref:DUF1206 domain-containing protein n=1 Tax=Flagellimonas crocea TaxID=3067311 RepID=UPI00296E33D7|nr:DUF1206 domain-containing protein [Muricauda sp. DH64]
MDTKIKQMARMGYAAKGAVYSLTGGLAAGAAIGFAKSSEGKLGVIKFLQEQPFGNVLLGILAVGLLCYALWRFFECIKDPENIGTGLKAIVKRVGFFLSGLIYLGLSVYSVYQILQPTASQESSGSALLPTEYLELIFYVIAIGMAIKAIFHIVKAYKGTFLEKFHLQTLYDLKTRKTLKWMAYAGLISRAIVAGIVAYFFFTAADTANSANIKGTSEAFSFLRENSEGSWLMFAVALGLICYGVYMFILAKYRKFKDG